MKEAGDYGSYFFGALRPIVALGGRGGGEDGGSLKIGRVQEKFRLHVLGLLRTSGANSAKSWRWAGKKFRELPVQSPSYHSEL